MTDIATLILSNIKNIRLFCVALWFVAAFWNLLDVWRRHCSHKNYTLIVVPKGRSRIPFHYYILNSKENPVSSSSERKSTHTFWHIWLTKPKLSHVIMNCLLPIIVCVWRLLSQLEISIFTFKYITKYSNQT